MKVVFFLKKVKPCYDKNMIVNTVAEYGGVSCLCMWINESRMKTISFMFPVCTV